MYKEKWMHKSSSSNIFSSSFSFGFYPSAYLIVVFCTNVIRFNKSISLFIFDGILVIDWLYLLFASCFMKDFTQFCLRRHKYLRIGTASFPLNINNKKVNWLSLSPLTETFNIREHFGSEWRSQCCIELMSFFLERDF